MVQKYPLLEIWGQDKMGRRLFSRLVISTFLQLIILFPVLNAAALSASETATADKFVREVHAFKQVVEEGHGNWLSSNSPWFAYIDRPFEEGLSSAQQKQYLALQTKGECNELLKLEKAGFLNLNPELSKALTDKIVENSFFTEIISTNSHGFMRCRALSILNPIIENEKKLDPEFYYLSIPGTNLGDKPGKIYDSRKIGLRKSFKVLFDLAACEDYEPALGDILKYSELFLIFVSYRERYYFYTRAKHFGFDAPDIATVEEDARQLDLRQPVMSNYRLVTKLKSIGSLLADGRLDAARKITFISSYISCGKGKAD